MNYDELKSALLQYQNPDIIFCFNDKHLEEYIPLLSLPVAPDCWIISNRDMTVVPLLVENILYIYNENRCLNLLCSRGIVITISQHRPHLEIYIPPLTCDGILDEHPCIETPTLDPGCNMIRLHHKNQYKEVLQSYADVQFTCANMNFHFDYNENWLIFGDNYFEIEKITGYCYHQYHLIVEYDNCELFYLPLVPLSKCQIKPIKENEASSFISFMPLKKQRPRMRMDAISVKNALKRFPNPNFKIYFDERYIRICPKNSKKMPIRLPYLEIGSITNLSGNYIFYLSKKDSFLTIHADKDEISEEPAEPDGTPDWNPPYQFEKHTILADGREITIHRFRTAPNLVRILRYYVKEIKKTLLEYGNTKIQFNKYDFVICGNIRSHSEIEGFSEDTFHIYIELKELVIQLGKNKKISPIEILCKN